MHQHRFRLPLAHGHLQGTQDELGAQVLLHRRTNPLHHARDDQREGRKSEATLKEASAKRVNPSCSKRRRTSESPARPPSKSSNPNVRACPVTAHCKLAAANASSRWMVGSATWTMDAATKILMGLQGQCYVM